MLNKQNIFLVSLIAISVTLHILIAVQVDTTRAIAPDTESYQAPALSLLEHHRYWTAPENTGSPETTRTPGYPLFLSIPFAIFGIQYLPVIFIQILLFAATVLLTYLISKYVINQNVALFASTFLLLDFASFIFQHYVLTETLFTFLLTLSMFLILKLIRDYQTLTNKRSTLLTLAFSISFSFATLVRPVSYYYFFLILPIILLFIKRQIISWKKTLITGLLIAIPWFMLVGGWQIRNFILTGNGSISSIQGVNMLFYRAAGTISTRDHIALAEVQEVLSQSLPNMDNLSNAERSKLYMKTGQDIILQNPLPFLKSQFFGFLKLIGDSGSDDFLSYLGISETSGPLGDLRQIPFSQFVEKWSHKPVYIISFTFGLIYLLLVYILSFISIITLPQQRYKNKIEHIILVSLMIYLLLVSTGPEADARLRIPIMPFFSIYAAAGLSFLVSKLKPAGN